MLFGGSLHITDRWRTQCFPVTADQRDSPLLFLPRPTPVLVIYVGASSFIKPEGGC